MNIYKEIPKLAHELAHEYCDGKWIAVGGGGYDIWRVVPRAWSLIWMEMNDHTNCLIGILPSEWLDRWQKQSPVPLIPTNGMILINLYEPIPRKAEIEEKNTSNTSKKHYYQIRNQNKKRLST